MNRAYMIDRVVNQGVHAATKRVASEERMDSFLRERGSFVRRCVRVQKLRTSRRRLCGRLHCAYIYIRLCFFLEGRFVIEFRWGCRPHRRCLGRCALVVDMADTTKIFFFLNLLLLYS